MKTEEQLQEGPLGRQIYFTARKIANQAENLPRPYDLTLEQLHLIKTLADEGERTPQQLAQATGKSAGNLTRLLARLEKKGLVKWRGNPRDRRSKLLLLTSRGRSMEQEIAGFLERFGQALRQGISEQDQDIVSRALARIRSNLEEMES